jgi:hypothetical protein
LFEEIDCHDRAAVHAGSSCNQRSKQMSIQSRWP